MFMVANFTALEEELGRCMDYIPFIETNKGVVSPKFTPILFEACSLVESIFRHMEGTQEKTNFRSYAFLLEGRLELEEAWTREQPAWWSAYNTVKHDRVRNYGAATFTNTVLALAALHQVIARSWLFLGNLAKAAWFNEADDKFSELMEARAAGAGPPSIAVETKLFVSPVRDTFVSYEGGEPQIEPWKFSMRVKNHIWEYEGW